MPTTDPWFKTWFDSPYYHLLYKNRDESEAACFIDNLLTYLRPAEGAHMLDLACGKGRHAQSLADKGFDVVGLDLSPTSIAEARHLERDNLKFVVHDMREVYRENAFGYVFNFFTSFGYFEHDADNVATARAIYRELKPGGRAVIDFMNVVKVKAHLVEEEIVEREAIRFVIRKKIRDDFIIKSIQFRDDGFKFRFYEKVQALTLDDFKRYLQLASLELVDVFGSYALDPFDADTSDRLIIIARKPG